MRNGFEDSRIAEGTREPGSNPSTAPERESSAISRDDVRDGFADPPARHVISARKLTGYRVRNRAGEDLGSVDEIMIDASSGRVAYAVLSFGGFLGFGDKRFAVPWNALDVDERENELILDADRSSLDGAPGFDKDQWPDMADPSFGADVHKHYGRKPYWEHDVTDAGDYSGDNHQPNRSIEFERTAGYSRRP